jgi:hypothetical protein
MSGRGPAVLGLPRCLVPLEDGGVCRERVRRADSGLFHDAEGRPAILRLVFCAVHGMRRQEVRDTGPSPKGYVPRVAR